MPRFLEDKLKREYGENSAVPFKVMNKIGAMKGNKETEKGREMEKKHEKDKAMKKPAEPKMTGSMKSPMRGMRIEIHRGPGMKATGHTVHHEMMPSKTGGSGAFMEETNHSFPFDAHGESSSHGNMLDHIADHLGMGGEAKGEAEMPEEAE